MFKLQTYLILLLCVMADALPAQERINHQVIAAIKEEGFQRSEVMHTLSYLTDVYGPRLLGTPGYREAAEWARDELDGWGLSNARLEIFDNGYRGWQPTSFSMEMIAPRYAPLHAWPKAWTRGTNGEVTGVPILIEDTDLESLQEFKGKLAGKIVMLGHGDSATPRFRPFTTRFDEATLADAAQQLVPVPDKSIGFMARRPIKQRLKDSKADESEDARWYQFFLDQNVAAVMEASNRDHNILRVDGTEFNSKGDIKPVPYFVVATEQYSRMVRMLEKGVQPTLKLHLDVEFFENPENMVNVVAELPGSDRKKRDEIVMVGGHFDAWHSGTGATDNAAGCSVMMEVMRILQATGVKPKRTIRIGLWGGEEEGYLGSRGYLKRHVGDLFSGTKRPEQTKISAYFNLDNGSGQVRGLYLQGNEAVRPIFQDFVAPFASLGATTLTIQNTSWTDHEPFDALGVPAFQFIQDPLNYMTVTHHTNLDVYEYVVEDDLKQSAVIIASLVYHIANRDQMLPRKVQ